jgi:hypothetical protein
MLKKKKAPNPLYHLPKKNIFSLGYILKHFSQKEGKKIDNLESPLQHT